MPRRMSAELAAYVNQDVIDMHSTVHLIYYNGIERRFARLLLPAGVPNDGSGYNAELARLGDLTQSQGADNLDRVNVEVFNHSGGFGGDILNPARVIDSARARIGRLFTDPNGVLPPVHQILFVGRVAQASVKRSICSIQIVSEIAAAALSVSSETLSEKNGFVFPYPQEQTAPGSGDNTGDGGVIDGGGNGGGGNGCFTLDSLCLLPSGAEKPIGDLAAGDAVMSFDPLTGKLEPDRIVTVFHHEAARREIVELYFDDGMIIRTTPEHPFYLGSNIFQPAGALIENMSFYVADVSKGFIGGKMIKLRAIVKVPQIIAVRNLHVERNHTFIVAGRGVHNNKVFEIIGQ